MSSISLDVDRNCWCLKCLGLDTLVLFIICSQLMCPWDHCQVNPQYGLTTYLSTNRMWGDPLNLPEHVTDRQFRDVFLQDFNLCTDINASVQFSQTVRYVPQDQLLKSPVKRSQTALVKDSSPLERKVSECFDLNNRASTKSLALKSNSL